jgi:hypothetical protein
MRARAIQPGQLQTIRPGKATLYPCSPPGDRLCAIAGDFVTVGVHFRLVIDSVRAARDAPAPPAGHAPAVARTGAPTPSRPRASDTPRTPSDDARPPRRACSPAATSRGDAPAARQLLAAASALATRTLAPQWIVRGRLVAGVAVLGRVGQLPLHVVNLGHQFLDLRPKRGIVRPQAGGLGFQLDDTFIWRSSREETSLPLPPLRTVLATCTAHGSISLSTHRGL